MKLFASPAACTDIVPVTSITKTCQKRPESKSIFPKRGKAT